MPIAIYLAAIDKLAGKLRGFDLCVLIVLWQHLSPLEYRKLKQARLIDELSKSGKGRVNPANLRRAMRRLESLGYLQRGPRSDRTCTYCVIINPTADRNPAACIVSPMTPKTLP